MRPALYPYIAAIVFKVGYIIRNKIAINVQIFRILDMII